MRKLFTRLAYLWLELLLFLFVSLLIWRVVVKLNYENEDEYKFLYLLRGKLANYFFGAEIGSFIINTFYYVDHFMSTINYAILYTDIIENQYFGDTKSPILKIIPINQLLIIWTTSSSLSMWSLPTVWGLCLAEVPQTKACLNSLSKPLWIELQKSAMEQSLLIITGAS